jgi:hypothetical protein
MKPFEIYSWQPPGVNWHEPHPCVIVSHPSRASSKPDVEVLLCSTQRAKRTAEPHEIILDDADGLDWPTLCKCDLIYAVPRTQLGARRGVVGEVRQRQMLRTLLAAHGWGEVLAG